MWAVKPLAFLAVSYIAVLILVYAAQTSLLFPTGMARSGVPLPEHAERLELDIGNGERLRGVRIAPSAGSAGHAPVLLCFGGNAWNAGDMAAYVHQLFPVHEVVAFHYRGYSPSTGRPSAAALMADAPRLYDLMAGGSEPRKVVAIGFSIGTGVAAHLASKRRLDGLLLVTPFDSLERLAHEHYRWAPVGLLLQHRMSPIDDLRGLTTPVALIAAEHDRIVPPRRTAALRKVIRTLVLDRTIAGVGHNDIYAHPAFREAMVRAVALISARSNKDDAASASDAKAGAPSQRRR